MHPFHIFSDGYEAGNVTDEACLIPVLQLLADPVEREKLVGRLGATENRDEQEHLRQIFEEIDAMLQIGEPLDRMHFDALRQIAGVAGLEVQVNIGKPQRWGRGVEGYCHYGSE